MICPDCQSEEVDIEEGYATVYRCKNCNNLFSLNDRKENEDW